MNWSTCALGAYLQGLEGAKGPMSPASRAVAQGVWRQMLQTKCKYCLAEGRATGCPTCMVALLRISTAALKRWRAGDASHQSQILWRVGRKKVVPRLLVSLLSLLGMGCLWQGWPSLLELLPALVTPVVSFRCTALHAVSSLGFPSVFKAGLQRQAGPPGVPLARAQCDLLNG